MIRCDSTVAPRAGQREFHASGLPSAVGAVPLNPGVGSGRRRICPMSTFTTSRGRPLPLGISSTPDGHNFALLCRHGTRATLVILPETGGSTPLAEFELHTKQNRTGDHWHIRVTNLPRAFCYGWLVDGPHGPRTRFGPERLLLDPAAAMLSNGAVWAGTCEVDPQRTHRRSLWSRAPRYDWEDDYPPLTQLEDSLIYEVHVRGFTCHESSKV